MVRATQRAPRSCIACSKRKIKCDKSIPCQPCVSRAEARECRREVVKVRGQVRTGQHGDSGPSYEDVLQENARLRALLADQSQAGRTRANDDEEGGGRVLDSRHEEAERRLFAQLASSSWPRTVFSEQHIVMPSRTFSHLIVKHAFHWTFWVHYALFIPAFEREHSNFWNRYLVTQSLQGVDQLWLAIYFAVLASNLLFMDEGETADGRPNGISFMGLLHNWYESSLFFLDRADFTQNPSVSAVKTIAILGIVFNNVGDVNRHRALWSVALQQAQQLKMGVDSDNQRETYVEQQLRRRLWWTLIICDWLAAPHRSPSINDSDFDCRMPDEIDDEELASCVAPSRLSRSKPRPIEYHIAMIRVAKVYYQIRYKLRLRIWDAATVAGVVFSADEQLATLISGLPSHLQLGEEPTDTTRERDLQYPFIPWQKESLSIVLSYYRMSIGRLLQDYWLDGSITGTRTRAICMSSAQGLINCSMSRMNDASKMRPWSLAMNIFSACATLAWESSVSGQDFSSQIREGLSFLRRVRSQNIVAEHSIKILESLLLEAGAEIELLPWR